jgi:hypothetical protein
VMQSKAFRDRFAVALLPITKSIAEAGMKTCSNCMYFAVSVDGTGETNAWCNRHLPCRVPHGMPISESDPACGWFTKASQNGPQAGSASSTFGELDNRNISG